MIQSSSIALYNNEKHSCHFLTLIQGLIVAIVRSIAVRAAYLKLADKTIGMFCVTQVLSDAFELGRKLAQE